MSTVDPGHRQRSLRAAATAMVVRDKRQHQAEADKQVRDNLAALYADRRMFETRHRFPSAALSQVVMLVARRRRSANTHPGKRGKVISP